MDAENHRDTFHSGWTPYGTAASSCSCLRTDLEEQTSSIELQKRYYTFKISGNLNWENAGIFAERATGLNQKERPEFHKIIRKC